MHTNTEQLTQFPMGVITEADVREHKAATVAVSDEVKTWTQIIAVSLVGTVLVCVIGAFSLSSALSPRLSRIDSAKALILTTFCPEKGTEYIQDKIRPAKPQR